MRLSLVIAVLSVTVVSGCTVATAGTPQAASSNAASPSGSSPSDDLPSDGAPKVENPLDVSRFEENPCDALTSEDAKTLNIPLDSGEQSDNGVGQTCQWRNSESRAGLAISFFSQVGRGLSSVYAEAKSAGWPLFERIDDLEGHPAVAFSVSEAKPTYECNVSVGVTDQLSFTTWVSLSDANAGKRNPCDAAAQAAGMFMRTMEAGWLVTGQASC